MPPFVTPSTLVTPSTPWPGPCQGGGRQRPTSRSVPEATRAVAQSDPPASDSGPPGGARPPPPSRHPRPAMRGRALRRRKCWWARSGDGLGGLVPRGGRRVGPARGSQPGLSGTLFPPPFPTHGWARSEGPCRTGAAPRGPQAPLTCLLRGLGRGWRRELGGLRIITVNCSWNRPCRGCPGKLLALITGIMSRGWQGSFAAVFPGGRPSVPPHTGGPPSPAGLVRTA